MSNFTDPQFTDEQWQIMRYLYNKEYNDESSEIDDVAGMLNVDKAKAMLLLAQLKNEGWVSHITDIHSNEHYVISLEGFTFMQNRHRT